MQKRANRPLIPPAVLVHRLKLSVNIRHQELSCHYIARSQKEMLVLPDLKQMHIINVS